MADNKNNNSNVLNFKKKSLKEKHKGKTLCLNGFHKWVIDNNKQFDVKTGKLITVYRCQRCKSLKTKAQ